MPSFTNNYTEPGTYVAINDDIMTQTNTGLLSVCIIGTGITTKQVKNQGLVLYPPIDTTIQFVKNTDVFTSIPVWVAGTTYNVGDIVGYLEDNKIYTCTTENSDATFDSTHWNSGESGESTTDLKTVTTSVSSGTYYRNTVNETTSFYRCIATTAVPKGYSTITANVEYNVGDFGIYSEGYYRCIEANTAPDTIDGAYIKKYWTKITYVDPAFWTAEVALAEDINKLPEAISGAISTRQYNEGTDFSYIDQNKYTYVKWDGTVLPEADKNVNGIYTLGISYLANKSDADYKPKSFTRLSNVLATYGPVSTENTISAAAQIAADNGATVFYCIQPDPRDGTGNVDVVGNLTETGLRNGLTMAKTIDTYCIVPMIEANATVGSLCKAHVESMSTTLERKERIAIISGELSNEENDDIDEVVAIYKNSAASINSPRVVYIAPSKVNVLTDNGTVAGSGMYAAAALAGIICNNNFTCGEPISGRTLADVTVEDRYTREEKNQMAAYGCLVLEGAEGTTVPKVRHALSTATGDFIKSEIKITKIKDVISNTLRLAMDRAYINTRFVGAETISEMSTTVNTILSSFLANNDIVSYRDLVIVQNINYPNEIDISFRIQPSVDINYLLITFGVSFQA